MISVKMSHRNVPGRHFHLLKWRTEETNNYSLYVATWLMNGI